MNKLLEEMVAPRNNRRRQGLFITGGARVNIKQVLAQSAGVVLEVIAAEGARVEIGEELLVCETMKMEIPVEAPCSGTVRRVLVSVGQIVQENDLLIELMV